MTQMSVDFLKPIVFPNFEVYCRDNLFYEVRVFNNEFGVDDLKLLVEAEKTLSGKCLPVLVYCYKFASTNIELLNTISKNSNNPYSIADAFIISSMAQKLLANFYLRVSNPERPSQFFNNEDDAKKWLEKYIGLVLEN